MTGVSALALHFATWSCSRMLHTRPCYVTLGDLRPRSSSPILDVALQINLAQNPTFNALQIRIQQPHSNMASSTPAMNVCVMANHLHVLCTHNSKLWMESMAKIQLSICGSNQHNILQSWYTWSEQIKREGGCLLPPHHDISMLHTMAYMAFVADCLES